MLASDNKYGYVSVTVRCQTTTYIEMLLYRDVNEMFDTARVLGYQIISLLMPISVYSICTYINDKSVQSVSTVSFIIVRVYNSAIGKIGGGAKAS